MSRVNAIVVNDNIFKRCFYKHEVANDQFGSTVLDKRGWTTKNHSLLIEGNDIDNVILIERDTEDYDRYEVYEDEW